MQKIFKISCLCFFFTLFTISCSKNQYKSNQKINIDKKMEDSIYYYKYIELKEINEMRQYCLKNNMSSVLVNIGIKYENLNYKELIMPDAFFFAETKGDPLACHIFYLSTLYLNFPEIKHFDESNKAEYFNKLSQNDKNRILKYLHIGAEKKHISCVYDLIEIYKYENNPKANYYKSIKDFKFNEDFYKK